MTRKEIGMQYFTEGYNCSQSVVKAFSDLISIPTDDLMRISSSFGGGMSRLREVCGTVSGIAIVLGYLYGYDGPESGPIKNSHYARIQEVAHQFESVNGSIVCRELLGLSVKHDIPVAAERTVEYYKKRPCKELIGTAIELLEQYIEAHPLQLSQSNDISSIR